MGLGALKGHYIFAHEGSSYETYIRLLNYGDRPCKVRVFCGAGVWGQTLRDSAHDASLR